MKIVLVNLMLLCVSVAILLLLFEFRVAILSFVGCSFLVVGTSTSDFTKKDLSQK